MDNGGEVEGDKVEEVEDECKGDLDGDRVEEVE